jgi:putative tricarboxylic transport membrane protein
MTLEILLNILSPHMLFLVASGTLFGVVLGAIPGLSGTIGIALLLPLTFSMEPDAAILTLGGIFMGGMYGGSITAILINVPGDLSATCTAFDGYPLAKTGRAKEALYYSIFSSMFGGLFGCLALILFTPQLANIALKFGPPEMFFTALCGLAVVASLSGKNIFKSFWAVAFGMLISMIGLDGMTGIERLTFGLRDFKSGISVIPVCIGLFCFAEMFQNIGKKVSQKVYFSDQKITKMHVIKDIIKKWKTLIKSSGIGTLIGILPGIGASMAIFLSYGEAKRNSKSPETFGHGNVEGIIAAESANNSLVGGTMVPMLALGIPGSPTAAMIGSSLTIHGMMVGPELFSKSPEVAYTFLYGMLLTVFAMALIGTFGIKYFAYILKAKMEYIVPIVLVFAMFGTYSLNNNSFEVTAAIVLGIFGALFKRLDIPCAPVIIGAVLSPLIELNLRRSMIIARAQGQSLFYYIITRPLCVGLVVLMFVMFYLFFSMSDKNKKRIKDSADS